MDRYQIYDLSFEQAERIYRFEEERDTILSSRNGFSIWEEWDYEQSVFQEVLNVGQFESYQDLHQERLKKVEQDLREQDALKVNDIDFAKKRFDYYESQFRPSFDDPHFWKMPFLPWERNKIDFLKNEYKVFVTEQKKQILVEHFRQNRTFMPNQLKFSLLWQQVDYLWPNYQAFQKRMDDPTKAINSYLITKVAGHYEKATFLEQQLEKLDIFNHNNFMEHYGNPDGWHSTSSKMSSEEVMKNGLLTLLLVDKDRYGLTN
jgi:hypothetical protein